MLLRVPSALLCLCTDLMFMVDIRLHSRAARLFDNRAIPCLDTVQVTSLLTTPSGGAGPVWIQ
jgi:hypothetical protein